MYNGASRGHHLTAEASVETSLQACDSWQLARRFGSNVSTVTCVPNNRLYYLKILSHVIAIVGRNNVAATVPSKGSR
jgi:hypothetical protein